MRRHSRQVIRFHFGDDETLYDTYWAVIEPGREAEMCVYDPGFDVDLYVQTTRVSMGGILMGRTTIARETESGALFLSGDARLVRTMDQWLRLSDYAGVEGIAMLA